MLKKVVFFVFVIVLLLVGFQVFVMVKDFVQMKWDEIVVEVKKEGEVSWFYWYFQDCFCEQIKVFEIEIGIKVMILNGDNKVNQDKMLVEKLCFEGDIDVILFGGLVFNIFKLEEVFFGLLKLLLFEGGKFCYNIEGVDNKGYVFVFWGNQIGIVYNLVLIFEVEFFYMFDDFVVFMKKDLGQFGFNIENGGFGLVFIEVVICVIVKDIDYMDGMLMLEKIVKFLFVWDWFKVNKVGYVIIVFNVDSVMCINSGEFKLVVVWEDQIVGLQVKGEVLKDIKMYVFDFGMFGGGNVLVILVNVKYKVVVLVFINWLISGKMQIQFVKIFGIVLQNFDVDSFVGFILVVQCKFFMVWVVKFFGDDIKKIFVSMVMLN